jgi:hypothetical protein
MNYSLYAYICCPRLEQYIALQLPPSASVAVQMSLRDWQLYQAHTRPMYPRYLKHPSYPGLHLSFDRSILQQVTRPPQPPCQFHGKLHLSGLALPV